jgi:response regulator NasT
MQSRGIGETEAYGLLRSTAMNQNRKIVDVARALITASDLLR